MIDFEIFEKEQRIDVCVISSISDDEFQIDLESFWRFLKTVNDMVLVYESFSDYLKHTDREIVKKYLIHYLKMIKKIDF